MTIKELKEAIKDVPDYKTVAVGRTTPKGNTRDISHEVVSTKEQKWNFLLDIIL